MAGLRSAYLLVYNAFLSSAWGYVVFLMFAGIRDGKDRRAVFKDVKLPLQIAQTAAILEVVHAALGVVRSPVMTTFVQVLSRIWCLWGIVLLVPEATTKGSLRIISLPGGVTLELSFFTLLFAWGVTEVLRYAFFAVKEITTPPYFQLWLRYTTFIPLYPLGVSSELTMAYLAMPYIKAKRPLSITLPNKWNYNFDYYIVCWIAIISYLPGFPMLYLYMMKQRKKLLGGKPGAKRMKKA